MSGGTMDWALLDAVPDAILVVDPQGRIVFANVQAEQLFGHSRAALCDMSLEALLPARFRKSHVEQRAGFAHKHMVRPMDSGRALFGLHKDGTEIPLDIALSTTRLGDQVMAIAAIRDLTGRRRLEERVRQGDELGATLDSVADAVIATDLAGRVVRMNPTAERLTGCSVGEAIGLPLDDVVRVVDARTRAPSVSPVQPVLQDRVAVSRTNRAVLVSRDGTERPVSSNAAPIHDGAGELTGVVLVIRDQSEEHHHLARLERSEARYRSLFDNMSQGLALHKMRLGRYGPDFEFLEVNRAFETLTGLSDVVGKKFSEVISGIRASDPRLFEMYGRVASTGLSEQLETYVEAMDEWFSISAYSPMKDHLVAAFANITERKLAADAHAASEVAAVESRAQLRAILENAPDFVLALDRDGDVQFINRALAEHTIEGVIGSPWLTYLPPEHHDMMRAALADVLGTGEPRRFETSLTTADDSRLWFSNHLGPVRMNGEITGAVLIARDVTQAKHGEAHLLAADRMATIGMLAAGVAHEINNPLAAVMANLELALREASEMTDRLSLPSALVDELRDAFECAERIRTVVTDLRIVSRAEADGGGPVDVNDVLESTLRMAWNEIRHRARVVKQLAEVPLVDANESRLGQVFLNLVINAAHAISEGHAEHNEIRVSTQLDADGNAVVEIADTGSGMSPETQRLLFTPFFTTKPPGVGTGLGLSICHRIVSELGGTIEVESELGSGTVFRVRLPPASSQQAPRAAAAPPTTTPTRRGRILVVDDEPSLCRAISRALATEHDVEVTTRAQEALGLIGAGERFDVILCDLMMPEVTGVEFYEQLKGSEPAQADKIIFMSGGTFTATARQFLDSVPNARLSKPFDPQGLRDLINERIG